MAGQPVRVPGVFSRQRRRTDDCPGDSRDSSAYDHFALTPLINDLHNLGIDFTDGSGTRWTRFAQRRWGRQRVLRLQPPAPAEQPEPGEPEPFIP